MALSLVFATSTGPPYKPSCCHLVFYPDNMFLRARSKVLPRMVAEIHFDQQIHFVIFFIEPSMGQQVPHRDEETQKFDIDHEI